MNFRKILAFILTNILLLNLSCAASAKTYEYDLKTYDYVENCSTVNYVMNYPASIDSTAYIVKNPDGDFVLDFINSNVNDILAIEVSTEQVTKTDGSEGKRVMNIFKYTKDISLVEQGFVYNPSVFKGTYVSIPYGQNNGFYLGNTLETLGYSSAYTYGFSSVKINLTCKINVAWDNKDGYGKINTANFIGEDGKDLYCAYQSFTTSKYAKELYKVYPFRTSLYPKTYKTDNGLELYENDVLRALKTPKFYGTYYFNPVAEINDLIAANDDVVFTFVSYTDSRNKELYNPYTYLDMELFNGGLVINNNLTLQLQDTNSFYWGDNKLSFYWSDITGGKVTNANQFLSSMLLYTSRPWYWDSLIVEPSTNTEVEVDDVSAGSGILNYSFVIE